MGAASSLPTPLRLLWRQPTPFDVVAGREPTADTTKARLMATSRAVEGRALLARDSDLVIATFQHRRHYTAGSRRRYEALATTGASVVVMGMGLGAEHKPGRPREVPLAPTDGLALEWDILVIGARSSYAFAAREISTAGLPDGARRFSWAVTHDPLLVKEAALALAGRVPGLRVPGAASTERL